MKNITLNRLALAIASVGILTLYGCGGGGGGGGVAAIIPAASQINGTAATGAALANAPVVITNSASNSPCVETSITTSALGSYTCTLKSGETAPFFIVITDPTGEKAPLVSIAATTPAAGTSLTVNATPLTTAIVAQLNGGDALGLVANKNLYNAANLVTITTNVLAQLQPVLTAINAPTGYNPFTTSITAATAAGTGNTADQVLDIVKVSTDPTTGGLALSTITNLTPVPLASATVTGMPLVAPTFSASDLGSVLSTAASAFNTCFADAPSIRVVSLTNPVPAAANGGPDVSNVSTACQSIVANGTIPSGKPAFKHNGYSAGQFFYGMLNDPLMTGAKFSAPEVMAFYPANSQSNSTGDDRAILNVRYIDNAGNPGNVITVAANYANTSTPTRLTNWWLVGNQQSVDITVKTFIRRVEQVKTGTLATNATSSGFQSGLQFIVSTVGPNSVTYNLAQISGPGLPTTGLWYFKNLLSSQTYMDMSNYRPATSVPSTGGTYQTGTSCTSNCPNYSFGKTQDLVTTTSTLANYITNPTSTLWSKGVIADGSFNGPTGTRPVKGDKYTINLYNATLNATSLVFTVTKTLLTEIINPDTGSKLPWNSMGTQTQAALDPNNTTLSGQLSSLTLDWVQNTAAQQVGGAMAWTTASAYSNTTTVPKGATTIPITPPSTSVFTSTVAPNNYRSLILNYRMLDGSIKSAQYTYN